MTTATPIHIQTQPEDTQTQRINAKKFGNPEAFHEAYPHFYGYFLSLAALQLNDPACTRVAVRRILAEMRQVTAKDHPIQRVRGLHTFYAAKVAEDFPVLAKFFPTRKD